MHQRMFTTDSGLETTAVFKDGIDLPAFAAIHIMRSPEGRAYLESYFRSHLQEALQAGLGFVLESPTWRASRDWAKPVGVSVAEMTELNTAAVELMKSIKQSAPEEHITSIVVSGCVGPRADGYRVSEKMTAERAADYHMDQMRTLVAAGAERITAMTLNYVEEAIGIAHAARELKVPVVISFTVETDGRLPSGESLKAAMETVDGQTQSTPLFYMINCAHPTHFDHVLEPSSEWTKRIGAIRANASRKSHQELDNSTELDEGDPTELASQLHRLREKIPNLELLGGCCGTNLEHIRALCRSAN